jgi:hypothetical protein
MMDDPEIVPYAEAQEPGLDRGEFLKRAGGAAAGLALGGALLGT